MSFVPVHNVAQLEYVYRWDGQIVQNVLHYGCSSTVDVESLQGLTTAAIAWWTTHLRPNISSACSLITVRATDLTTQTGPVVEDTTGLPLAGSGSSSAQPNNVTVAIKLITANRGRSFRGRVFHVGLSGTAVVANEVSTTTRTNLRNAYLAAFILSTAPTWSLVVASKFTNNAPRLEGLATVVSDVSVNPTVDSQRRRLPERGV